MKMRVSVLLIFLIGLHICSSCEPHERKKGCRIHNKRCSCDDFACPRDYPYENFEACQNAVKGKRNDNCFPNPCMHGGTCIQVAQQPGFKCRCEGTGFYGARCNRACPKGAIGRHEVFPYECIVI